MSTTAADLCLAACKRIGAVDGAATALPRELADTVFLRLNTLIDLWATQRLTINGVQKFSLAVIAGHNPYTIGPAGDFNQARPVWLPMATITIPGTYPSDIPIDLVDAKTYAEMITSKTTQSSVNQIGYYDQAGPPTGNLYLWPIPDDATYTLNIWVPVALTQFAALTTAVSVLPGYQAAIEYNLAADLMPEFGRPLDPQTGALILQRAADTLGWIKRANMSPTQLWVDPGMLKPGQIVGGGNWYTGP